MLVESVATYRNRIFSSLYIILFSFFYIHIPSEPTRILSVNYIWYLIDRNKFLLIKKNTSWTYAYSSITDQGMKFNDSFRGFLSCFVANNKFWSLCLINDTLYKHWKYNGSCNTSKWTYIYSFYQPFKSLNFTCSV